MAVFQDFKCKPTADDIAPAIQGIADGFRKLADSMPDGLDTTVTLRSVIETLEAISG